MTYAFKPLIERLRDPALMKRWWDQYGLEAANEIERLEKLVYVPGLWRCAKCACETVSAEIHAESGRMRAGQSPQACPNGCGPMWRITERDAGNRLIERMDPMQEEITRLRAALEMIAGDRYEQQYQRAPSLAEAQRIARAALAGSSYE